MELHRPPWWLQTQFSLVPSLYTAVNAASVAVPAVPKIISISLQNARCTRHQVCTRWQTYAGIVV